MKYLIDTHILLWYIAGNTRISSETIEIIENRANQIFISNASLWEIAIKQSIGKLELSVSLKELFQFMINKNFIILEFDVDDLEMLQQLPFHHQDPFDRIIISQSKTKNLKIITNDNLVLQYFD